MSEIRMAKINSELQKQIYNILAHQCNNSQITEMFSITGVDCDRELKTAKVYVSILSVDDAKKQATFDAICRSAGFVRKELARVMRLRTVPELHFLVDKSVEHSTKINQILAEINKGNT